MTGARFSGQRSALAAAACVLALAPVVPASAQATADQPPAPEPAPAPMPERPPVRAVFGATSVSFVALNGQDRTWSLASAGAAFNTSETGVTSAEVQRTARPGLSNVRAEVRHDEHLTPNTAVYVQVSASDGDPLREQWGVGAGIVQRLSKHIQLTLDARAARYRTPGAPGQRTSFVGLAINPGVIITPKGTPLELTAQAIVLRNDRKEWQLGAAFRATWYTGDRDLLFAGLSRYPENELGRVRQLTSAYVGLRRELGGGIGLRATAEYARLEGAWHARTLSIGLEKRF